MATSSDNLYIQAPEMLSAPERTRDSVVTAIMWMFYLYLWVPLLSLMAWLLGFEFAYDVMIRSGGAINLASVLLIYGAIIGVIFCVVTTWSLLNRFRFRGITRRRRMPPVSDRDMADYFEIKMKSVRELRASQSVNVDFDETGKLLVRRN